MGLMSQPVYRPATARCIDAAKYQLCLCLFADICCCLHCLHSTCPSLLQGIKAHLAARNNWLELTWAGSSSSGGGSGGRA